MVCKSASAGTDDYKMVIFIPSIYLDNERLSKSGTHSLHFVSVQKSTLLLDALGLCEDTWEVIGKHTWG